ncbi:hypothetical protein ACHAPU_009566 [Fusarium lateritium]
MTFSSRMDSFFFITTSISYNNTNTCYEPTNSTKTTNTSHHTDINKPKQTPISTIQPSTATVTTVTTAGSSAATEELSEIVLCVLSTVADAVVGVGEEGVEEVTFTCKLAGLEDWSAEAGSSSGENDEELGDLSHFG